MKAGERPAWGGLTVACLASGPSLTAEDCDAVRRAGLPTVVTNTTFRLAPWADVLFGFDSAWWRAHREEVSRVFAGRLITVSQIAARYGVESLYGSPWFRQHGNSGTCAIALAVGAGARRVVLLGYDCGPGPGREMHWHGDHPKGLTNCASMGVWPAQFERVAKYARKAGCEVVNASRRTALKCFETVPLEQALQ